jgi:hypothetical protein
MNKTTFYVCTLICLFTGSSVSQNIAPAIGYPSLHLKESSGINKNSALYKKSDAPTHLYALGILALISPMAVFEDKKVFFALTKEVSIGKFPYGRLAFEYSYIFRNYNKSHFRFSYNYDIVLEAGDFIAILATPGAGYFTDTKNKGWFIHGAAGIALGGEPISFYPYLRYRHTFIHDKLKSDIDDISLGCSFIFFF